MDTPILGADTPAPVEYVSCPECCAVTLVTCTEHHTAWHAAQVHSHPEE